MNFKHSLVIYRKELMEVLRDKRTIFTTFILPIILYPFIIIGFNSIMIRQTRTLEDRGATVAVKDSVNNAISRQYIRDLMNIKNYTIIPYNKTTPRLYEDKDIQSIVTIRDSIRSDGTQSFKVYIQYDKSKDQSRMVFNKLYEQLSKTEKDLQKEILQSTGISPDLLNLRDVRERDTSSPQKKMGMYLGIFLPYFIIMMLFVGASIVSSDLVAGEKERKTLETLLVSSVGRLEIVCGKYLTIITLAMLNMIVNLISISFSLKFILANQNTDLAGVSLPVNAMLILLIAMIPLATLFAAILLSISTFSRNIKEARSYEQPLLIIAMLLGMVSFFPAIEISNFLALIPVVNIALLFKAVLINEYALSHILITIFSTLFLDLIAILVTIKLFKTESVLFRTEEESSGLKALKIKPKTFFKPYNGILYFSIALIVLYYLGSYWQARDLFSGLIETEIIIIALPVLLTLKLLRLKPKEVLRLKIPKWKSFLFIPFIAISAQIIASIISQLINIIFPFPEKYIDALSHLYNMNEPSWKVFLAIALLPGICEELLFRGFLIRFFEKYSLRWAVVISAILFAAFHLDPFRFVPVLLLGLLLGYLAVRSGSIYSSMFSHLINNGMAFALVTFSDAGWVKFIAKDGENINYWLIAPALIIFCVSLYAFHKATAKGEEICVE
ncbi:MAG TPA: ABC transporter permease subunit/CPBP intramembrane protease [Candidatus Cloacimonadota bacterium]|nr:ABC transporter permease subunit/CPBP intramembrane protease [Candidatus Cloacimonadota bacterium]